MILTDFLSLFSYIPQDYLPKDGTTHSGVGPFTSVVNQKKKKKKPWAALLTGKSDGGIFSVLVLSYQMTLDYVK